MDPQVELTHWEYKAAVDCGNTRMAVSNDKKLNHANTQPRNFSQRIGHEIVGACGEIAVCKAMNWYWSPSVNTFHFIPDIGAEIEVRATERENGCLVIRDDDKFHRWFILVTGQPPHMTIRGRIKGEDAKRDEWLRNPHGHRESWFVPQSALIPIRPRVLASA